MSNIYRMEYESTLHMFESVFYERDPINYEIEEIKDGLNFFQIWKRLTIIGWSKDRITLVLNEAKQAGLIYNKDGKYKLVK